jgi:hypothetical protein
MSEIREALDKPEESAAENLGPHLLGAEIKPPDPRNLSMGEFLELEKAGLTYDENLRTMTLQELIDQGYLQNWTAVRIFWRWLKGHLHPPAPEPIPTPTPAEGPPWNDPIQLDQGNTGHCVGFGWCGWGDASPVMQVYQNTEGHNLYYQVKEIEGEPQQENGAYVPSGAKAMIANGRASVYVMAKTTAEIDAWLAEKGPVVAGSNWYSDMFNPDPDGYVRPTGTIEGGHCWLILNDLKEEDSYEAVNSWGTSWGLHGHFKIKKADFQKLLDEDGDAVACSELPMTT